MEAAHKKYFLFLFFSFSSRLLLAQESVIALPLTNHEGNKINSAWQVNVKSGEAKINVSKERGVIALTCEDASFAFERSLPFDIHAFPVVSWRWKADVLPPLGDVRNPDRNDQALQLLTLFKRKGGGYKTISYVWDSNAPLGTVIQENWNFLVYKIDVKVVVVESGSTHLNKWMHYERNLLKDYRQLYGEEPIGIVGLRLQTNCQYTHATGKGYFDALELKKSKD